MLFRKSPAITPEAPLARSEFMRQDLGPIVTHLTSTLYKEALSTWQPPDLFVVGAIYMYDIPHLVGSQMQAVENHLSQANLRGLDIHSPARALPIAPVTRYGDNGPLETRPTHYETLEKVLNEGLRSGIVMPWAAYAARHVGDNNRYHDPLNGDALDLENARRDMQSPGFRAALGHLAHAPNGFYGSASSSASGASADHFNNVLYKIWGDGPYADASAGYTLAQSARNSLHTAMANHNRQMPPASANTDGCPVRGAHFPKLGPIALRYAEEVGISPETLMKPGSSGVAMGAQFVVESIEKLIAARQDAQGTRA